MPPDFRLSPASFPPSPLLSVQRTIWFISKLRNLSKIIPAGIGYRTEPPAVAAYLQRDIQEVCARNPVIVLECSTEFDPAPAGTRKAATDGEFLSAAYRYLEDLYREEHHHGDMLLVLHDLECPGSYVLSRSTVADYPEWFDELQHQIDMGTLRWELLTLNRPSGYLEYAPYHFLDSEDQLRRIVSP